MARKNTSNSKSDQGQSKPESDQRPPENLGQVGAASAQTQNTDASAGASKAAPQSISPDAAPLIAVTMVNLAGKYYEPGMRLEKSQIAKDKDAIPALLAAHCIREG